MSDYLSRSVNQDVHPGLAVNPFLSVYLLLCLPAHYYACEAKVFSCSEMLECHIAMNDSIRRIFSFNRWESIRHLRDSLGYHDLYHIFSIRKRRFLQGLNNLDNKTLRLLLPDV